MRYIAMGVVLNLNYRKFSFPNLAFPIQMRGDGIDAVLNNPNIKPLLVPREPQPHGNDLTIGEATGKLGHFDLEFGVHSYGGGVIKVVR